MRTRGEYSLTEKVCLNNTERISKMERIERLREFLIEWETKAPFLKELTWEIYEEHRKEVAEYEQR